MPIYSYAGRFGPELLLDENKNAVKNTSFRVYLWNMETQSATSQLATLYVNRNMDQPLGSIPQTDKFGSAVFYAKKGDQNVPEIAYGILVDGATEAIGPVYVDEPPADTIDISQIGQLVAGLEEDENGNLTIPLDQLPANIGIGDGAVANPIIWGVGPPAATDGVVDQLYYDRQNVAFYGPKTTAGWGSGASIKGQKGDPGDQGVAGIAGAAGADGNRILTGTGAPNPNLGNPNDFYLQYNNGAPTFIWGPKSAATGWGSAGLPFKGDPGEDGDSAYEIAVASGFSGSQADWLASLTGPAGPQGPAGAPGASDVVYRGIYNPATAYVAKDQVAFNGLLYIANTSTTGTAPVEGGNATWAQATARGPQGVAGTNGTNGAVGAQGPAGTNGVNGTNGTNGSSLILGSGPPASNIGQNGDSYLDKDALLLYGPKASGAWPTTTSMVKGAKGDKGDRGDSGSISLEMLLRGTFSILTATYNSSGVLTSATVKWPDSSSGVYTPISFAPNDQQTVDAYRVTHAASGAVRAQPSPTRNSAGFIISRPDIVIEYPQGSEPDYDPSAPTAIKAGEVYAESLLGYINDGTADMAFWLQNVLDNLPKGKTLCFGPGEGNARVALSKTVFLRDGNAIKCPPRPKWLYKGQPFFAFVPFPGATFDGTAMFKVEQPSTGAINKVTLSHVVAYGQKTDSSGAIANINGLEIVGETFGVRTDHCGFRRFGKTGVKYTPIVNSDGSGKQSRGHEHVHLSTESCGVLGLDTDGLTDSDIINHHAHYCGIDSSETVSGGTYLRGAADVKYTNARHTFCEWGLTTGDSTITQGRPNGNEIIVHGLSTDRSRFGGLRHRAHGTRVFSFVQCIFGRDGRVESHSGADSATVSATASFAIEIGIQSDTRDVAPISFSACQIQFGVDDASTNRVGESSPGAAIKMWRNGIVQWANGIRMGTLADVVFGAGSDASKLGSGLLVGNGSVDSPVWSFQNPTGAGYILYNTTTNSYPARPAGLANGDARYKGPIKPSDIQTLDDWIETD